MPTEITFTYKFPTFPDYMNFVGTWKFVYKGKHYGNAIQWNGYAEPWHNEDMGDMHDMLFRDAYDTFRELENAHTAK